MTNNHFVDHEHINWGVFEKYLREQLEDLPSDPMRVKKFSEGYSNQTYLIRIGEWEGVMRRPPFGEIPPKAHDMNREYQLLQKVYGAFPLAPKPYIYAEDETIMNRHFYVMEKKDGLVIDEQLPDFYAKQVDIGEILSESVIETLTHMQSIDIYQTNLHQIGKPDGYLDRQINGWVKRYDRAKTDDISHVKELEDWFLKAKPEVYESTIVHNDFKMNNLVFDRENIGQVNGVLDWELATVGDPMTDVGASIAYWIQSEDPDLGIHAVSSQPGFYSRTDFAEAYARTSGRDLSHINFYVSFGFYKLAVILQQIYARWEQGELHDDRFKHMNKSVANLIEMAHLTKQGKIL